MPMALRSHALSIFDWPTPYRQLLILLRMYLSQLTLLSKPWDL